MSTEQIIGLIVVMLVMTVGLVGSILPALPSTPIVLIAAVAHRLYFHEHGASNLVLIILTALTLFSLILDFIASLAGAKRLGATWRGATGAVVGALVGMFFSLPGIILGPFLGALLFEMAGGRNLSDSTNAGIGAVFGLVVGAAGKLACCLVMMLVFFFNVLSRSGVDGPLEVAKTVFTRLIG